MKKMIYLLAAMSSLVAAEQKEVPAPAPLSDEEKIAHISEALGHLIGKTLETTGIAINWEGIVKGLRDAKEGKAPPMNEEECLEALTKIRQTQLDEAATKNLAEAQKFLDENKMNKDVILLEEGKVQIQTLRAGSGEGIDLADAPLIRYKATFLDGSTFAAADEEKIQLEEIITGLSKGMVGMKEGEVRKIYIHPDLAYGKDHPLQPNALLTFEIELLKAEQKSEHDLPNEVAEATR